MLQHTSGDCYVSVLVDLFSTDSDICIATTFGQIAIYGPRGGILQLWSFCGPVGPHTYCKKEKN